MSGVSRTMRDFSFLLAVINRMSEGDAGTPDTSDMTSGMSGVTSLAATGISEGPGMDPGSESVVGKSVSANGL